jgi:serine/threonine protein kinase HipA of HipAB toxin-antitoxin module
VLLEADATNLILRHLFNDVASRQWSKPSRSTSNTFLGIRLPGVLTQSWGISWGPSTKTLRVSKSQVPSRQLHLQRQSGSGT